MTTVLSVRDLEAGYGGVPILRGVSVSLEESRLVAILGPNGAGKSTLLRAISGLINVSAGHILLGDTDITRTRPEKIATLGVQHAAEGHRLFKQQTVHSNLMLGMWAKKLKRVEEKERIAYA